MSLLPTNLMPKFPQLLFLLLLLPPHLLMPVLFPSLLVPSLAPLLPKAAQKIISLLHFEK